MNYNTVYVGMDVHKESFSLCAYTIEAEKASHYQRTEADYKKVLNYLEFLRTIYGDDANFICGYEAGWGSTMPMNALTITPLSIMRFLSFSLNAN